MFPFPVVIACQHPGVGLVMDGGNGGLVEQIDGASPYDTTVGIRFNTDGTVEVGRELNGGGVSWSAAGDWLTPVSEITGNEEVRFTGLSITTGPGSFTTLAATEDTWIGITTTRTWLSNKTISGDRVFTCTFEVRDTGAGRSGGSFYTFSIQNVV